jgi:hypothetical protein
MHDELLTKMEIFSEQLLRMIDGMEMEVVSRQTQYDGVSTGPIDFRNFGRSLEEVLQNKPEWKMFLKNVMIENGEMLMPSS